MSEQFYNCSEYLLSANEQEFLLPFAEAYHDVYFAHRLQSNNGEDGEQEEAGVSEMEKAHFRNECIGKRLDMKEALSIATRFSKSSWFTFYPDLGNGKWTWTPAQKTPFYIYCYCTSDAPIDDKVILPIENPAFYDAIQRSYECCNPESPKFEEYGLDMFICDIRQSLRLQNSYLYLDPDHYNVLSMIFQSFTVPAASTSSPPFIAYPKDAITQTYFANGILPTDDLEDGFIAVKSKMKGGKEAIARVARTLEAPATSKATLSLTSPPQGFTISHAATITQEHNDIFKVICSYYLDGKMTFTDAGICNTLYIKNTAEQRQKVNALILDMMPDIITIDTGNVGDFYNFPRKKITAHVLPIEIVEDYTSNQRQENIPVRRYTFIKEPVFLTYASMLNQMNRFPRDVFDTGLSKTVDTLRLHFYLLDRICAIPRLSNCIRYDSIFDELGVTGTRASINNKKAEIRKKTRLILHEWMKKGYISGFHEETKTHEKITAAKRGVSSYCVVIHNTPKLAAKKDQ